MSKSINTEKLNKDCLYILFLSQKCSFSAEIKKKIEEIAELSQIITIMEIEALFRDGEKIPRYIKGTPTLIVQHRHSGQVMSPMEGDSVFNWLQDLVKIKGNSAGGVGGDESSGVSIGAVNRVNFDPKRIKHDNLDPAQFQIPTEGKTKGNSDLDAKLKAMSEEAKNVWSRK
jgi:hypothetical protein